jgi:hypothetical protein
MHLVFPKDNGLKKARITGLNNIAAAVDFRERVSSALSRASLNNSLEQAILASVRNFSQNDEEWTYSSESLPRVLR